MKAVMANEGEGKLLEASNTLYKVDRMGFTIIHPINFTCPLNKVVKRMTEESKPGVSKRRTIKESSSSEEDIEEIDPSCITDELLQRYASEMPSEIPITVSEELFYSGAMVQQEYEQFSEEDKKWFDQMKCWWRRLKKKWASIFLLKM